MKPSEAVKVLRNSGLRGDALLSLLDSIIPTIQQKTKKKQPAIYHSIPINNRIH